MNFHRTYDISCVSDTLRRKNLENAIEAVNFACTPDTNAWLYVESRQISEDYQREFSPSDTMKYTLFNHMKLYGHSSGSIGVTICDLVAMATEYSAWKRAHDEDNSICEGEKTLMDQFKKNTLVPYYRSMSGGGSRMTAGPIVSEFLELYDRLEHKFMPGITELFYEVTGLLGNSLQDKVDVLDTILDKTYSSPRLSIYRDSIKQRLRYENNMDRHHNDLITKQRLILQGAIESRNPVALRAALNPGWGSMKFFEQKEYKEASTLLNQLEET
jgi:hypothetical protein